MFMDSIKHCLDDPTMFLSAADFGVLVALVLVFLYYLFLGSEYFRDPNSLTPMAQALFTYHMATDPRTTKLERFTDPNDQSQAAKALYAYRLQSDPIGMVSTKLVGPKEPNQSPMVRLEHEENKNENPVLVKILYGGGFG